MEGNIRKSSLDRDEKLELTKLFEQLRILTNRGKVVVNINDARVVSVEVLNCRLL